MERVKRKAAVNANEKLTAINKPPSCSKRARKDDQTQQVDQTEDLNNNESLVPEVVNNLVNNPPTSAPTQHQENPSADSNDAHQSSNEQLNSVHFNKKIFRGLFYYVFMN